MNISFFLTRPESEGETGIYARICYSGLKFKYYLPEKISPKFWSKETKRVKQTSRYPEYPEFNSRLDSFNTTIKNVYRKFINDNAGVIPVPDTLRRLLDKEIKKREPENDAEKTFVGFFQGIISQTEERSRLHPKTGKPISHNTLKTYKTTERHLLAYQQTKKRDLQFKDIDLDFYSNYTEFLTKKLNLSTNTVGKHIQIIKMIMNEATERGVNNNLSFKSRRFITLREKTDSIYLTDSELKDIASLDLSENKKLERVRDLFLIGCFTGLRFSDSSILTAEQVHDGFITITQVKTGEPVVIPVHDTVRKIIEKYNGMLPPSISNQKTNEYLKTIGKMIPALNVKTTILPKERNGLTISDPLVKWQLLTTHTARRSFSSNQYKAGIPAITIMAITGHRTEKAFLRYIKLTPNEHAKILKGHWDKQNKLTAVK